ncbi:MAG: iron-containing redox enzyme family protein [Actinocatenispora sp.]
MAAVPADPYGDDAQLALNTCYELHYRGYRDVDPDWEWHPTLLRLRGRLERLFGEALRRDVTPHPDVASALDDLLTEPVEPTGPAAYLERHGHWWQMREYLAHRSVYHLKEADPHAWVIPRLQGQAKAALVAVEYDEFGAGRAERVHATLFADLLRGAGLDDGYGRYVDDVPASMLAVVNMMSLFGLHRTMRGALVGHFAAAEIGTPPSARRLVRALERMDADAACTHFYAEHVEADAVHEQVMRHEVVADLLHREPDLARDVVWGIDATAFLETRFGTELTEAWQVDHPSLRTALPFDERARR